MTIILVVANILAYVLQMALASSSPGIIGSLALSVDGLSHGKVWQLLTFQFMHGGWGHLLFNSLTIYMFGREVEASLGRKTFLTLYLASGVFGGLLQVIFSKVLALLSHEPNYALAYVVGASAGAFGLIAAFATLHPEQPLMLILIPVSIRAKFLLLFEAIVALLGMGFAGRALQNLAQPNVAHAAHLGGMITGIVFIRFVVHSNWPNFGSVQRRPLRSLVKVSSQKPSWGKAGAGSVQDLPPDEFLSREVDPILDKISAQGIQSLTERERRILEAARQKMAKR